MKKSRKDYIVFGKPMLNEDEIQAVVKTLRSGWIGTGPKVKEFENAFATYTGTAHASAVSSCTAALQLALQAYGIGPGDEVITTAMTFAGTVNAIVNTGARPVLADIEPGSFNIDFNRVEDAITRRTRAILPVHFGGAPVDMDALLTLKKKHGLRVIQDCAHAIETRWENRHVGSFPDAACYSFYPTKNITAIEGGMICTNDEVFTRKVRLLSYQGVTRDAWKRYTSAGYQHYDVVASPGYKFNMTDVQATLGLSQLRDIEHRYRRRAEIWHRYQKAFAGLGFGLPGPVPDGALHALHLFTLLTSEKTSGIGRDQMIMELHERGIGTGVHYRSIAQLTAYRKKFGWKPGDFPNARKAGDTTLSLPLTPYLTDSEVERIVKAVREIARTAARKTLKAA